MTVIWATRGEVWGFRFLRSTGIPDPLLEYDRAFAGIGAEPRIWRRVGKDVALRFPDPSGRKDRSGRVIPHDFVVFSPLADQINSVEDGLRAVWPLVADEYARAWKLPEPPATG